MRHSQHADLRVLGSWSKRGHLLASGSDDTYLNIWAYNPANIAQPFTLSTSVSTGHQANIFSVKFMPHSADRTVITCAGDSQVRVFDLEYAGSAQNDSQDSAFTASTRSRRFNTFFRNARWLNEGNTNAKVYRSHSDRVKRVVTESSPFLFLTCSEDGEVRQWDLRQPSSAYPAPRSGRRFGRSDDQDSATIPPPLISYKRYVLDLNTISCSGSQPQYIALGGAHLHCFLHDRRMIGRDLISEKGQNSAGPLHPGTSQDDSMNEATRCVRRFAPNDKRKMGTHDHGHITACKISDANPNELIASWSGDHIYSFDIVKSPDAREAEEKKVQAFEAARLRNQRDRKRKRTKATASSSSLTETANPTRRLRRVADSTQEDGHTALRVRYENGQTEDIPINTAASEADEVAVRNAHDALLTEAQLLSERVARSLVKLRQTMFDFSTAMRMDVPEMENSAELTPHTATFTQALGECSTLLPQMDDIIRGWTYPVNPTDTDVTLQNTLRRNRQASWRFVQACGCLARTLGGRLQTPSSAEDSRIQLFDQIRPAAREGKSIPSVSRFCYDFLKAILLWLNGGLEAILAGFKQPADHGKDSLRFPLGPEDGLESLGGKLHAYLSDLADGEKAIVDLDANRFEHDDTRVVFPSQKLAVNAFTRAISDFRLEASTGRAEDVHSFADASNGSSAKQVLDKGAAARFWAFKVGRSLLMDGAEGVTFDFVNRAFGGLRVYFDDLDAERSQEDIDPEEELVVEAIDLINAHLDSPSRLEDTQESATATPSVGTTHETADTSTHAELGESALPRVTIEEADEEDAGGHGAEDDEEDDDDNDDEDHSEDEDSDADEGPAHPLFRHRVAFGRPRERAGVNMHVPYSSHTREYKGHCNTRTVKDVNFYGLNDEYVVSGSDDGHFFIWDRKTTELLNILEGDGEVVNVVQGHPYEPMIACSGIDSTVKIFGVGNAEREEARQGINVANPGGGVHSSLRLGGRMARRARLAEEEGEGETETERAEDERNMPRAGLKSRKAMHRQYEILNQNDVERRRGIGDAFMTVSVEELFTRAWLMGGLHLV